MRMNLKNIIILSLGIATLLLYTLPVHGAIIEPHDADAMWIEPSSLDLSTASVGYTFNITLALNISETNQVAVWQTKVLFDNTYLNAVDAGFTDVTKSDWLKAYTPQSPEPTIENTLGYVLAGESLVGNAVNSPGAGTLCWIEFNLTGKPSTPTTLAFNITQTYSETSTYIGDDVNVIFTPYDSTATIPEFPSAIMLPILMLVGLATAALTRRHIQKRSP